MNWIRTSVRELFGLFVDDGSFAAAIVVWIGWVWISSRGFLPPGWAGPILFAGLGAILLWSTLRRAKR